MTADESSSRSRRRRRALIGALIALALALPVAAVITTRLGHRGAMSDALRRQLTAEVVAILESSPVIAHTADSLHQHGATPVVMCTVDPFGTDPPGPADRTSVQWVYAQHLCVIAAPGTPWDFASKTAGPVAVFVGAVPQVRLPLPPGDYRTQVAGIIPARYQAQALGTFAHPQLIASLRARFAAARGVPTG